MNIYLNEPTTSIMSGDITLSLDSATASATTPAGSKFLISKERGKISPRLYFNFVKSRLSQVEVADLKDRLKHFSILLENAEKCGQRGFLEEVEKMVYILLKEQEASVCGYGRYVLNTDIDKYRHRVEGKTIKLTSIEQYPRPIPSKVSKILEKVKDKAIFDSFFVLYNDPISLSVAKTTKDKIVEKDPILFGRFSFDLERSFYITDWVDEHCDLTLKTFLKEMNKNKVEEEYKVSPGEVKVLSSEDLVALKKRVEQRVDAIQATNSSNWKENAILQEKVEELEGVIKKQLDTIKELYLKQERPSLWKRFCDWLVGTNGSRKELK